MEFRCLYYNRMSSKGNRSEYKILQHTATLLPCIVPQTGVYSRENGLQLLEHSPRDFLPIEAKLQEPSLTVKCVLEAIRTIYEREKFS